MRLTLRSAQQRAQRCIMQASLVRKRLIGLALFRVIGGAAGVLFYLSDYTRRDFLWGPHGYVTISQARAGQSPLLWSLYFVSGSHWWFEMVFHLGIGVAIAFTVFGGRFLTVLHAVFLWSIYNRNPQILEGGDNLMRICIIFMAFATTNAYFSPGARRRRARAAQVARPSAGTLVHNIAAFLVVFQVAVVYAVAG